jgi:hypothetical protein
MARPLLGAAAFTLAVGCGSPAEEGPRHPILPGWERLEPAGAAFAVNMPRGAAPSSRSIHGVTVRTLVAKSGTDAYVVGYFDLPPESRARPVVEMMREQADGFVHGCGGQLLTAGPVEDADPPMLRAVGVCDEKPMVGEIHTKDGKMVSLFVVATDAKTANPAQLKAFFKSFTFLGGPF